MNDDDQDMKEAVNELGRALATAMPGASKQEVQNVIDAVDTLVQVRLALFAELAADRFDVAKRKIT